MTISGRRGARRLSGTLMVLAGLAALAAATAALALAEHGRAQGRVKTNLGRELRELVAMRGGPPGAIAIVRRPGSTTVYRAGVSDVSSGARMGANQYMRLASVSKAFSGAVALSLVNRHVLALSDTVGKRLPWLPASWRAVTLAEALHHTSGLPDFTKSKRFVEYLKAHLHATPSPRFLLRFVAHKRLGFRPGTRYRYSNTDNFVVALMARAASRRHYRALLASRVYAPLHLTHTRLPAGPRLPARHMHGYDLEPPNPPDDFSTLVSAAYSWASGGMISTPSDLGRFIRGYVGGRLFSRRVQARQFRFVRGSSGPPGPGQNSAGLAIFRYRTRCGTVYGHTGNTFGYTQFAAATRDGKRSVVVSINAQINDTSPQPMLAAFRFLRKLEGDAVCSSLR